MQTYSSNKRWRKVYEHNRRKQIRWGTGIMKNKNKHYHTQGDTSETLVSLQIAVNPRSGSYTNRVTLKPDRLRRHF